METAVDDSQHGSLEHLAVAMSVSDLLHEVSKIVDPGTPVPSVQCSFDQRHPQQR